MLLKLIRVSITLINNHLTLLNYYFFVEIVYAYINSTRIRTRNSVNILFFLSVELRHYEYYF